MGFFSAEDGTDLYYKDWGVGQPVVFNHAYAVNGDAFENQMFHLATRGYRCIVADRRGHGRSGQPWHGYDMNTFADDLHGLVERLDLKNVVLVGHSTGSAVVARYIGRYGTKRIAKVVLIGVVTPLVLQTPDNPDGVPISIYDGLREAVLADRPGYIKTLDALYFGTNRPDAAVSQELFDSCVAQQQLAALPAVYYSIAAFSETDTTADLIKIDVPTLILHGSDDQIAPVRNAYRSAELIADAKLTIYAGASHAMIATSKDRVNDDILKFIVDDSTPVESNVASVYERPMTASVS